MGGRATQRTRSDAVEPRSVDPVYIVHVYVGARHGDHRGAAPPRAYTDLRLYKLLRRHINYLNIEIN